MYTVPLSSANLLERNPESAIDISAEIQEKCSFLTKIRELKFTLQIYFMGFLSLVFLFHETAFIGRSRMT